jgi:hypothetical protein
VIEKQDAVDMVNLVLQDHGEPILGGQLLFIAIKILIGNGDFPEPFYLGGELR